MYEVDRKLIEDKYQDGQGSRMELWRADLKRQLRERVTGLPVDPELLSFLETLVSLL